MSKIVLIAGDFDCINTRHINLIKEAKKQAMPDGDVFVFLFENYTKYIIDGRFPIQPAVVRKRNLEFFMKPENIKIVDTSDYPKYLDCLLEKNALCDNSKDLLYVHYIKDKEFKGREIFKKHGVKIKFIKEPKI